MLTYGVKKVGEEFCARWYMNFTSFQISDGATDRQTDRWTVGWSVE